MPAYHKPVLVKEVISLIDPQPGGVYLDATVGGGGHAAEILRLAGPDGTLIGIDRDAEALDYAREALSALDGRVILVEGNFRDALAILDSLGVDKIDGAIADLGVSSHQLDSPRGFTFLRDEELSMKMGQLEDVPSARDIVNTYGEERLAGVIWTYGEERYSRRIARAIVQRRSQKPITRTGELVDAIISAVPGSYWKQDIHPATRTFQAIRIEVNRELEALEAGIPAIVDSLRIGGRACVISFQSLEDRIVKNSFRRLAGRCECPPKLPECRCGARELVRVVTRKAIVAGAEEVADNPRSRSAKLRCVERID